MIFFQKIQHKVQETQLIQKQVESQKNCQKVLKTTLRLENLILIHLDNAMAIFDFGHFQEVHWGQPKTQNVLKKRYF